MPGRAIDVTIKDGPQTFVREINRRSEFAKQVEAATKKKSKAMLDFMAATVEQLVEAEVSKLYQRREGFRHKKGQEHLHGSFSCTIDQTKFPMKVTLTSTANPAQVAALNYGARPHGIDAKTKPLLFPVVGLGQSITSARVRRGVQTRAAPPTAGRPSPRVGVPKRFAASPFAGEQAANVSGARVKTGHVDHPGVVASYFMEIALEQGVERVLRKRVKLPR